MEYTKADYYGHEMLEFQFEGRQAKLVFPKAPAENKPWLLKTEYFWAFPSFERAMLENGWFVAHVSGLHRWHDASDDDIRHAFSEFLQEEFGLNEKCIPVGMSLGGLQGIYYASKYPKDIAGLYLDAPVINLLSCPGGVGRSKGYSMEEFHEKTGMTIKDLISYRNHPLDHFEKLANEKIKIFLICGDSDDTVPYDENGKLLFDYYTARGLDITQVVKPGCDHHPHGLEDTTPLTEWAVSLYKE